MSVMTKLQAVFRQTFSDEDIVIGRDTTADDIDGWDSLSHVGLIMAVEQAFSIRISSTEIATMENVGALADVVIARSGLA